MAEAFLRRRKKIVYQYVVVGELKFSAPPAILTPASIGDEPRWARIKTHVRAVHTVHFAADLPVVQQVSESARRRANCIFLRQFRDLCHTTISDRSFRDPCLII